MRDKMNQTIQGAITLAGRILLSTIFFVSAVGNKIPQFNDVAELMAGQGIPAPKLMLVGAILFLIVGSLSVIVGYKARIGAALLLVFLLLATYFFHDFWTWPENAMWILSIDENVKMPVQQLEMISFMKNMALMGAMLMILANGPGRWSIDSRSTQSQTQSS